MLNLVPEDVSLGKEKWWRNDELTHPLGTGRWSWRQALLLRYMYVLRFVNSASFRLVSLLEENVVDRSLSRYSRLILGESRDSGQRIDHRVML